MAALIVYVDDIIITGDWNSKIQRLKRFLATQFEVKDLGPLRYFLGIEVDRSNQGIFISQRKYVLNLLKDTGKLGAKLADSPIDVNHRLRDLGVLSQFMHAPKATHLEATHIVLRYLKKFPGIGLLFGKHGHMRVEVYTDADWVGSVDDKKSTSGYCAFVGGNLVTWRKLLWIKNLLGELGFPLSDHMSLYCDNKAAINISTNLVLHDRTKHIEVDKYFIREKLEE
ncbi:PREDICTED: uncharacterized protein LOC109115705 [Nelumbo nucifera]|uniref:Uncharacterized protein LOC109115705 n=1 Tax=Nelumbo nucifera TaxID=4432 RepID=A0A1U8Q9P4_NELNU|nr:PREDICTED: uncharacterized protein LOC109115705 [Nelumbo nucifera]